MALDFPSNPVNGQVFNGFTFDGTAWSSNPGALSGIPAGSIMAWPTATAPANWLICDGSAISRSAYASLFAAIGTTYGTGDGSTTFNIPDLRGRVPVGSGTAIGANGATAKTLGTSGGEETHLLTASESGVPAHNHPNTTNILFYTATGGQFTIGSGTSVNTNNTSNTGTNTGANASSAHNNLQPYQVVNYIIKYSASLTPGDSELATRVGAIETTTVRSVALGGTGASTLASGGYLKGNGTSAVTSQLGIPGSDVSGNISGNAANVTGTVGIGNGGTGSTTVAGARTNLGLEQIKTLYGSFTATSYDSGVGNSGLVWWGEKTVSFGQTFAQIPTISVYPLTTSAVMSVHPITVSTTGFTFRAIRFQATLGTSDFGWSATGRIS